MLTLNWILLKSDMSLPSSGVSNVNVINKNILLKRFFSFFKFWFFRVAVKCWVVICKSVASHINQIVPALTFVVILLLPCWLLSPTVCLSTFHPLVWLQLSIRRVNFIIQISFQVRSYTKHKIQLVKFDQFAFGTHRSFKRVS